MTVNFTVAIPTYNGANRLPAVLQHLRVQVEADAIAWEVLVVDNNSQDQTAAVVAAFRADFPCPVRYCLEPKPGAGQARWCAIEQSSSDLIGFLDDDTLPEPTWVAAAYRFAQQHPHAGAYGSRISAQFEATAPPANFKRILPFLAITERGDQPRLYLRGQKLLPPAAGLVVRKSAWLAYVPRQTLLDRLQFKRFDGNDCSEDLVALAYLQQSEWEIWYNPAMQIAHQLPAWRLERDYLVSLCRSIGLSRYVTRMVGVSLWQKPIAIGLYFLSDLRKVIRHFYTYRTQLQKDTVAACEMQLFVSSLISPLYWWRKAIGHKFGRR